MKVVTVEMEGGYKIVKELNNSTVYHDGVYTRICGQGKFDLHMLTSRVVFIHIEEVEKWK